MKVTELAKSELEEAGEDTTDLVNSTSKLQKQIKSMTGIDIMLDNDTFKSTYQILSEISNKWSELSDIDQANCSLYVQQCA